MAAPKLERLLNLTALLLDARRALSAEQIKDRLDYPDDQAAFRRAFERALSNRPQPARISE